MGGGDSQGIDIYSHIRIFIPMKQMAIDPITQIFKGFGDPNRLRILSLLANRGELCVCDLERVLDAPQTRISRHLNALKSSGLVMARREGAWMHYSLAEPTSGIHACQLDCLRHCFPGEEPFARDLETYDRKRQDGVLACGQSAGLSGGEAGASTAAIPSLERNP